MRELRGHKGSVLSAEFSPDGTILASGDSRGRVMLFDVASGRRIAELKAHKERCFGLAFSRDGMYLATVSWDRLVKIWDVETRQLITSLGIELFQVFPNEND